MRKLYIIGLLTFSLNAQIQQISNGLSKKPFFTERHKKLTKKSFSVAIRTLEVSVGLFLTAASIAFAKDAIEGKKIGMIDHYSNPALALLLGALGISFTGHGLFKLSQELDIPAQIKTVAALLKKQLDKKQSSAAMQINSF